MRVIPILVFSLAAAAPVGAAPRKGTIEVESADATAHDRTLLDAIARELESHADLWRAPPRGAKTFRLKTYARGGVRALTEQASSVNHVVACKLLRHRLWRLKLRSTAPRTLVVTFRLRPTS